MLNLNFVPLATVELLAFNTQKIRGHVILAMPPFPGFFSRDLVGTSSGSMHAKFEVRIFSHFGTITI